MRSQIIHLTLRQEGSTERRRAKLKNERGRKTNKGMNGANCKGAGGSRLDRRENSDECVCVCVFERANRREGVKKKTRERQWLNAIVLSYQDGRAILLLAALQCAAEGLVLR